MYIPFFPSHVLACLLACLSARLLACSATAQIAAKGGTTAKIFDAGLSAKTHYLHESGILTHMLWDRLIFNKIKAGLGLDNVRFVVTGSAPISPAVVRA